jgi:predicted nucleic acid-binding protein
MLKMCVYVLKEMEGRKRKKRKKKEVSVEIFKSIRFVLFSSGKIVSRLEN